MIYPAPKPRKSPKRKPKPMKRTRMKKFNANRGGHKFPKGVDEGLREFVRGLPCIVEGRIAQGLSWHPHICWGVVQVCHVKTRGAGGEDRNNTFPACAGAHHMQHLVGIPEFERLWGVELKKIAQRVTAEYEKAKFPCP